MKQIELKEGTERRRGAEIVKRSSSRSGSKRERTERVIERVVSIRQSPKTARKRANVPVIHCVRADKTQPLV